MPLIFTFVPEEQRSTSVSTVSTDSDLSNLEFEASAEKSSKVVCVSVHLDNLVGPNDERAVRAITSLHVSELEEAFLKNKLQSQYKILIGLLVDGSIELASKPGGCKVEVLGGNHTRVALQGLYKRGLWSSEVLKVEIHNNLSDEECLSLGVLHNVADQQSLEMSFMDEVRLIRRLLKTDPNKARESMRTVFNLKSITEVRHNYKTHEGVAKCTEEVWSDVLLLEASWKEKKPLKQTFFTKWLKCKDDVKRKDLLQIYIEKGLAAYKEAVGSYSGQKQEGACTVTTKKEADREAYQKISEENQQLKKTVKEKDNLILQLEEECKRLREMMKSQMKEKKSTDNLTSEKRKRTDVETDNLKPKKKVKFTNDDVCIGEVVWAKYVDGISYPAKVMKYSTSSKMYTVRYIEDGIVAEVAEKDIKRKQ